MFADDEKPVLRNDRAYVPLRLVSEKLGAEVHWSGIHNQVFIQTSEKIDKSKIPHNNSGKFRILIDNKVVNVNDSDGQAYINDKSRTMVPIRIIMENLNCDVRYDEAKREVSVITKEEEPKDNVSDPDKNLIEDLINKPIKKPIIIPEEEINNQEEEKEVVIKNPTEIISIKGPAIATSTQLRKMASEQEGRIKQKMENSGREFVPFPDVIDLYLEIGKEYGIRGDLAYAQALKETGYFQFTGQVLPFQNNYCGLWATGVPLIGDEHLNLNCIFENDKVFFIEGLHGLTFLKPEYGVEAHIQHLYAYVTKDDLPPGKKLVDPRFHHVNRGIAINWQDLNGRWAVPGVGYGESIIDDYWAKHKN